MADLQKKQEDVPIMTLLMERPSYFFIWAATIKTTVNSVFLMAESAKTQEDFPVMDGEVNPYGLATPA
jgi:hypothetical protein